MQQLCSKSCVLWMQHIYLVKGADDPNTYLVNDTADPLQRSLTCLELTDVLMGAPPPGASATWPPPTGQAPHLASLLKLIGHGSVNLRLFYGCSDKRGT